MAPRSRPGRFAPALLLLVLLPVAALAQRVRIGELSTLAHDVSGTVYAVDSRTFEIENFVYDGRGPRAFFWVGKDRPNRDGFMIPVTPSCGTERLPEFRGTTVRAELPVGTTIADIDYLSVWCEAAFQDFGNVPITAASRSGVPAATGAPTCGSAGTFPVQEGWNCETLNEFYQVRWRLNRPNINFELVAKIKPGYWMGFGVSGSETSTQMVNSDVVIATENNGFQAEDYFLSSRGQCANGDGACPDTQSSRGPGRNDVTSVSGERNLDTLRMLYTRPIAATEATDRAFKVAANEATFVSWATGPFNNASNIPQIHRGEMSIPNTDVSFQFGRDPVNNCRTPLIAMEPKEEKQIEPWTRPFIANATDITARIGPSGEDRGVAGITGGSSWGIAWYMSPTGTTDQDVLIPAIGVERGKTYTFRVFGGNNASLSAMHHPMYITSDKDGGFATKMPISRGVETIYAGINVTEQNATTKAVNAFVPTAMGKLCEFDDKMNISNVNEVATFADFYKKLDTGCAGTVPLNQAGVLKWTVPMDAPNLLYYQCVTHRDLGFKLVVFDEGQVDENRLKAESGGGPQTCVATFKGETINFAGCADVTPTLRVFWNIGTDTIETLFVATTSAGWAGFSWGNSAMVGSNAVIAYRLTNNTVGVDDYFLAARNSQGVQPAGRQNLTNPEAEVTAETIAARFTRPLAGPGIKGLEIGPTPVIWAIGAAPGSPTTLRTHTARGSGSVDLSATGSQQARGGGGGVRALFIAHGLMMGIAWIILVPMAVVAMRFFKMMNPTTFYVHRGLNSLAVLVVLIAFIMGVVRGSHTNRRHLGIGVVVTILAVWQGINGALRPHKDTSSRKPWFLAHAYSGRIALLLAVINIFFGIDLFLGTFTLPSARSWRIAVGVIVGLFVAVAIFLSLFPSRFPVTEQGPLLPSENGEKEDRPM